MGHHAADLHHQPAGCQEQRRPGRVAALTNQDLPGGQLGVVRVEHHPHIPLDHPRRYRAADQRPLFLFVAGQSLIVRSAVAQEQAWDLRPQMLLFVNPAPVGDQFAPILGRSFGQRLQLIQIEEEEVVRAFQHTRLHQAASAVQQAFPDDAHHADDEELGALTQAGQRPHSRGRAPDQPCLQGPAAGLPRRVFQTGDGAFRRSGAALEYDIRGLRLILDPEITLQRLHDGRGVLPPPRPADIDLTQAAHAVPFEKAANDSLGGLRQFPSHEEGGEIPGGASLQEAQRFIVGADRARRAPERQVHLCGDVVGEPAGDFEHLAALNPKLPAPSNERHQGKETAQNA